MKKLIIALFCLFLAGCGTFNIKVRVIPQATETAQLLATATLEPISSATPTTPLEPTVTAFIVPTPTPTLPVAESITLTTIQMSDTRWGWGVELAGRIVKTSDGGGLWRDVTPLQGAFDSHSLFAFNNETAWAVPSQLEICNIVWRTQDGGITWEASQPIPLGPGKYSSLSLQFPDVRHGWMLILAQDIEQDKNVQLYKSENGGKDWALVNNLNTTAAGESYLPANTTTMAFFDGQTGWLGGWWGKDDPAQWLVPNTSDGGAKWGTEALRLPTQNSIQCNGHSIVEMAPGSMAVEITCTMPKDPKYLFHRLYYLSTSGKPAWRSWVLKEKALSVYFLNVKQGWMMVTSDNSQMNQLLYTRDSGGTWDKFSEVTWKQAQFDFVNEKTGWAIIGNGFATALVRTENGGKVWIQVRPALAKP